MKNKHTSFTLEEAQARMERYCSYQERSHQQVRKKLKEMRMIPAAIDQIIHHLIQANYLNETRFAQSFARGKFRIKKWGRNRIVRELKLRDISSYNIKLALKEIPETDYLTTFEELCEKRLQQLERETNIQKKKKKLADYLFYRGWETHLVWETINQMVSSPKSNYED